MLSDAADFIFRELCLACLLFKCGCSGEYLLSVTHYVSLISRTWNREEDTEKREFALPPHLPEAQLYAPVPSRQSFMVVPNYILGSTATLLGSKHFNCVCVTQVLFVLFFNKVTGIGRQTFL